jgi:ArsR family transcriptional regulator, arsenate/arsenite/antimonite-responsive transcriptional repressor / arsenate reductase (thioredoxin)
MVGESTSGLERRAAVHQALGDPARLAVVDALMLGDASPKELQARLGMPSNLMAHHVDVLARVGLVRRSRSHADRRRIYLSLAPGVLDALWPVAARRAAARVVFVCTENSARSPLAAAVWSQQSRVPGTSAGTRPAAGIRPAAVAAARRFTLTLDPTGPRRLDEVLRPGDLVITVCDNAHEELSTDVDRLHWSIADPARDPHAEAFDRAIRELTTRITRLAPTVTPLREADHD